MTSVEIAKRYGHPKLKVGRFEIESYAFAYNKELDNWGTDFLNESVLCGICAIDDLCEDVSRSPWFMPMVDESGNVTEVRCG